jgi:hypothetical protein
LDKLGVPRCRRVGRFQRSRYGIGAVLDGIGAFPFFTELELFLQEFEPFCKELEPFPEGIRL